MRLRSRIDFRKRFRVGILRNPIEPVTLALRGPLVEDIVLVGVLQGLIRNVHHEARMAVPDAPIGPDRPKDVRVLQAQ